MKRILSIITIFALILVLTTTSFAYNKESPPESAENTYFIAFESKVDKDIIKSHGGEIKKQYKYMPVVTAKLSDKAAANLAKNPNIAYIEKDATIHINSQVIPWGVEHINATTSHDLDYSGQGIKIGIIDTGIDYTHEDLNVAGGVSFIEGTSDYMDDNGHGTHVAGTIGALDNDIGVIGVAPQADIYAIKALDQYGNGSYSDIISGIEWAIDNNIDIINMSIGGTTKSKTLETAVNNAYNAGILLVSSAGNNGYDKKGTITYPAAYNSVIAVGAVDQNDTRAIFSSVGRQLELMAPGVNVLSTVPNNGYTTYSGTSMASPHVAGSAALLWEANPSLSNVEIRNLLNASAIYLGDSFEYGNGLVDCLNLIK